MRCPEGHKKECFYQKHASKTVPEAVGRVPIQDHKGQSSYVTADSLPAVIDWFKWAFWSCIRGEPNERHSTVLTASSWTFDPDPAVPWKSVIEAAQLVKTLLNELKLECFVKTTGGKGLHVMLSRQRA